MKNGKTTINSMNILFYWLFTLTFLNCNDNYFMPAEIHCQPIIGENIEANVHSILYKEKESLE